MATQGFSSGFQQGFGLVNSVFDRRSQDQYRQGLLDQRREESEAQKQFRQNQLEEMNRQNLARERAQERADELTATRLENEGKRADLLIAQAGLNTKQAETARIKAETAAAQQDFTQGQILKSQKAQMGALAVNEIAETLAGIESGDIDYDQEAFLQRLDQANNTLLDVGVAIDPVTEWTTERLGKQIGRMAKNEKFEGSPVIGAMNIMLNQTNNYVGETIDSSYKNAPKFMQGGNYTIQKKEFIDARLNNDGTVTGEVLVTVEDDKGNTQYYVAPATEGRDATKAQVQLNADVLMQTYSGYMTYANAMKQYAPTIKRIKAESLYRKDGNFDNTAYTNAVEDEKTKFETRVTEKSLDEMPSPFTGMTNRELINDSRRFQQWAEHQVLFPESVIESEASGLQRTLGDIRSSKKIQRAMKMFKERMGVDISLAKLLEAQNFLDQDPESGEIVVDNVEAFDQWAKDIGVRLEELEDPEDKQNAIRIRSAISNRAAGLMRQ